MDDHALLFLFVSSEKVCKGVYNVVSLIHECEAECYCRKETGKKEKERREVEEGHLGTEYEGYGSF